MPFQSALSNDWHLTSVAGVSYLGVTTDRLQHVQFAERRRRARRQFFCHRIALSKALTNIFSDEPPSKGFVVCGTNRHRRHQWRPLTSNQGTQSLFPDTIKFQWNLDCIRCVRKPDQDTEGGQQTSWMLESAEVRLNGALHHLASRLLFFLGYTAARCRELPGPLVTAPTLKLKRPPPITCDDRHIALPGSVLCSECTVVAGGGAMLRSSNNLGPQNWRPYFSRADRL